MRNLLLLLMILLTVAGCSLNSSESDFEDSTTLNFNKGWEFVKDIDPEVSDDHFSQNSTIEWEQVSLPHTANIEPLVISEQQWQGDGFYRKFFEIDPDDTGKYIALKFHGAMHEADIWLNGEKIRNHKGGYLPFVVNISEYLNFDTENVLLVRLNNENNPTITPGKPIETLDFNWFSGLYRNVDLLVNDKLHITDPIAADRVAAGGVRVNYTDVTDESATVNIQTDIENFDTSVRTAAVKVLLKDDTGRLISEKISDPEPVPSGENLIVNQIYNKILSG